MSPLIEPMMCGLLGFGTGIFATLSLIEKPVWRLMWAPCSQAVRDEEAREVHAILKRVIHLLPPTMGLTMLSVSALIIAWCLGAGVVRETVTLASVFFGQLLLIVLRLFRDIRGVDSIESTGDIGSVRQGLGALALLHHRGLLMTTSTLAILWAFIVV